ncbi:maleylacetoacetate isomerase-like protein [Pilaira anomala]|nr:maleylacetoacetate isomerase-like protein [Pilaira anomala]
MDETKSDKSLTPQYECKPILYSSYDSDTSWRVRLALCWKNIQYETRYIDMSAGEHLSEDYAKLNPCKRLPCFISKTGKVITQSLAILEYLEVTYPERPILPKSAVPRAESWSVALDIACDIQPLQTRSILKLVDIGFEKREEFAREMIETGFKGLEKRLETLSGTYCVADQISVADFCLVPMVFAAKRHNVEMRPYPYIVRIRNTLMTLPEFRETHPFNQLDCPDELRGVVQ